jgi:hypothetical protein
MGLASNAFHPTDTRKVKGGPDPGNDIRTRHTLCILTWQRSLALGSDLAFVVLVCGKGVAL